MLNILLIDSSNGSSRTTLEENRYLTKDIHSKNIPSNKAYVVRKSMSIDISLIGILSQPVMRGSYT